MSGGNCMLVAVVADWLASTLPLASFIVLKSCLLIAVLILFYVEYLLQIHSKNELMLE